MISFGPTGHQAIIRDLTNTALGLHQAAGLTLPPPYGAGSRLNVTRKLCVSKATAARLRTQKAAAEQQVKAELQAREKALQFIKPSAIIQAVPLSLSPLSLVTSPAVADVTKAAKTDIQKAAVSAVGSFMNRLTRKNQKSTPAENLVKTRKAMVRLARPQSPQPIAPQPTTTVSRGIAANLGRAIRSEQNTGPRAYNLSEIQRRAAEQRAALPAAAVPASVVSKLDELRRIRNMPITTALEAGETELQRQMQRNATLAQAQKTLEAELTKLTPAQRAEYEARNAQRVAALTTKKGSKPTLSSMQQPSSSQLVSFSPQQSRR